jgi:hypothetical protein
MGAAGRFRVAFLALGYLAGNFGLPAVDLLLDHRPGTRVEARVHFETRGGARDHGGHCPLNRLLSELRLKAPAVTTPALEPASRPEATKSVSEHEVVLHYHPSYRSRAPPSLV